MLLTTKEIEDHLRETLPNVSEKDIHRAAQSIVDETGNWREIDLDESLGVQYSVQCKDICAIGKAYQDCCDIRVFIAQK